MELKLNQLELATALNFITGGNCTLTVKSRRSGTKKSEYSYWR